MIGSLGSPYVRPNARNLGVIPDSDFTFDKQINAVVWGSFFQLRTISKIKSYLSPQDRKTLVHGFISSQITVIHCTLRSVSQG